MHDWVSYWFSSISFLYELHSTLQWGSSVSDWHADFNGIISSPLWKR